MAGLDSLTNSDHSKHSISAHIDQTSGGFTDGYENSSTFVDNARNCLKIDPIISANDSFHTDFTTQQQEEGKLRMGKFVIVIIEFGARNRH